jgi:hypothetical protein
MAKINPNRQGAAQTAAPCHQITRKYRGLGEKIKKSNGISEIEGINPFLG